jgi:hypothetical protein
MDLVAALPASAESDGSELDLRTLLGTAWMALRGWPAQEVWDSLHPALKLANALRRNDSLVPTLSGLYRQVLTTGRVAESVHWVTQLINAAETCGDPDLLIVGHHAAVSAYFWLGDPIKTREHADRVLALYSEERHGHLVGILNTDPKTSSLLGSAHSTWILGYPDQAVRIIALFPGRPLDLRDGRCVSRPKPSLRRPGPSGSMQFQKKRAPSTLSRRAGCSRDPRDQPLRRASAARLARGENRRGGRQRSAPSPD